LSRKPSLIEARSSASKDADIVHSDESLTGITVLTFDSTTNPDSNESDIKTTDPLPSSVATHLIVLTTGIALGLFGLGVWTGSADVHCEVRTSSDSVLDLHTQNAYSCFGTLSLNDTLDLTWNNVTDTSLSDLKLAKATDVGTVDLKAIKLDVTESEGLDTANIVLRARSSNLTLYVKNDTGNTDVVSDSVGNSNGSLMLLTAVGDPSLSRGNELDASVPKARPDDYIIKSIAIDVGDTCSSHQPPRGGSIEAVCAGVEQ
jgi:hypothetical protein